MKLISRSKPPHPVAKGYSILKLALRGLVIQRMARNGFRAYKLARRLPLIIGGAAIAVFALKKLRGGGDGGPETWTAPPAAPTPAPIQTSGGGSAPSTPTSSEESPVETAATGTPPVGPETTGGPDVPDVEADGAPDPDIAASAAATDAGTSEGASEAVAADTGEDAATTIGDDLAAAADDGSARNGA